MEGSASTVSRPQKLNHVETILYEIDMLDHCFLRLREGKWVKEKDYYLCIEGFLLHYRNLTEFFGDHQGLRAGKPEDWSPRPLSDAEVASIQNISPLKDYHGLISRYLGHCDKIRAERDKEWKHIEMYGKIEPLLTNFRKLFPAQPAPPRKLHTLDTDAASTTTTSSFQVLFPDQIATPIPKKSDK